MFARTVLTNKIGRLLVNIGRSVLVHDRVYELGRGPIRQGIRSSTLADPSSIQFAEQNHRVRNWRFDISLPVSQDRHTADGSERHITLASVTVHRWVHTEATFGELGGEPRLAGAPKHLTKLGSFHMAGSD